MDLGLTDKYALVCAASRGMGRAVAERLAEEGATVFLCARSEEALKATAETIAEKTNKQVFWRTANLSKEKDRLELIQAVQAQFPRLDILIHNTGGPPASRVESTTPEQWQQAFEQLFLSVAHLTQAFLPAMRQNKWGRILTVTSSSVMEPIENLAMSNAMRAAVTAMMKTLATEVAVDNICVNCVAPGIIYTDRIEDRIAMEIKDKGGTREDHMARYVSGIPAGRLGTPEEYANLVCFLASTQAGYITGSTLSVDGGKRKAVF